MVKYVEIASYPRSGNRWLRQILSSVYGKPLRSMKGIHRGDKPSDSDIININGCSYKFFKSHGALYEGIEISNVIYIYRHPLACFISALNYSYVIGANHVFLNQQPKNVDEISGDGEMDFYFDDFLQNTGSNYFPFLGDFSNYFFHTDYWLDNISRNPGSMHAIKYENMLQNPFKELFPILNGMFRISESELSGALNLADQKSENNKLVWRKKSDSYRDYLSDDQINSFNEKYKTQLGILGYSDN